MDWRRPQFLGSKHKRNYEEDIFKYVNIDKIKIRRVVQRRRKKLHIYSLHVRSSMEYCSVAWHDNLTQAQKNAIERLQVEALKIILGSDCPRKEDGHVDYIKALSICNLKSLFF